jgi:hypothetical protein
VHPTNRPIPGSPARERRHACRLTREISLPPKFDTRCYARARDALRVPHKARLSEPIEAPRSWHVPRMAYPGMGTLLLVGEAWRGDADGSVAPRGPSLKGALKRVGYDVVHTEDGAGALAQLRLQPLDLIVLAGPSLTWSSWTSAQPCAMIPRSRRRHSSLSGTRRSGPAARYRGRAPMWCSRPPSAQWKSPIACGDSFRSSARLQAGLLAVTGRACLIERIDPPMILFRLAGPRP